MTIHTKNIFKSFCAIALIATAILFIPSCDQDPIFAAINEEIAIKDPTIGGNVYSLTLVGDETNGTLFTQNGSIYSKPVTAYRGWIKHSSPASNSTYLASDGENLYALAKDGSSDTGTLWYQVGATGDWVEVDLGTDVNVYNVFDNKAKTTAERNAYYTIEDPNDENAYAVYQITVASANTFSGTKITDYTNYVASAGARIISAARLNNTDDYFFDSIAFCAADVNADDGINDFLYKTEGSTIWYSTGTTWTASSITATDVDDDDATVINSLIAYGTDLYFATDYGLGVATIDTTTGSLTLSEVSDQAATVFATKNLYGLWTYSHTLFASTLDDDSSDYNYLWGCYINDDNEWNAE